MDGAWLGQACLINLFDLEATERTVCFVGRVLALAE